MGGDNCLTALVKRGASDSSHFSSWLKGILDLIYPTCTRLLDILWTCLPHYINQRDVERKQGVLEGLYTS